MCSELTWMILRLFDVSVLAFVLSWWLHPQPNSGGVAFLGSAVPLQHLSNPSQYPNSSNEMSASMLIVSKMAAAISPAPNTCVCMKTQTRWLMRLPLPALMALIFSSAERSHGLRCQMLFCSPPFTGLAHATRAAARRAFHVVLYVQGLMDSFIWGSDTAKRVWSSILFPPSIAVKY